jgi:hypothetical protein
MTSGSGVSERLSIGFKPVICLNCKKNWRKEGDFGFQNVKLYHLVHSCIKVLVLCYSLHVFHCTLKIRMPLCYDMHTMFFKYNIFLNSLTDKYNWYLEIEVVRRRQHGGRGQRTALRLPKPTIGVLPWDARDACAIGWLRSRHKYPLRQQPCWRPHDRALCHY